MRKATILLLCAVALVSAGPHTRIPESLSQTHENLQSDYDQQQQQSESNPIASASTNSASFEKKCECNHQEEAKKIESYSGVSGFPAGFKTAHSRPENTDELSRLQREQYQQQLKGESHVGQATNQIGQVSHNPFLSVGYQSGNVEEYKQVSPVPLSDHSNNPFLSGSSSSSSSVAQNVHPYPVLVSSTTARSIGAGNPFIINAGYDVPSSVSASASASSSSSFAGQEQGQFVNDNTNPFFNSVSTSSGQFSHSVGQTVQKTVQPPYESFPSQTFDQFDQQSVEQSATSGFGLKLSCSGQGKICIDKKLCNNGFISSQSVQGLTQIRSGNQQCDVNREVCCTIKSESGDQSPAAGTVFGSVNLPGNIGIIYRPDQSNGLFGDGNDQDFDFSTGDVAKKPAGGSATNNGYLPPDGNPSNTVENFLVPTTKRPVIEPAPTHLESGGCAAALICVEEFYCHMNGSASKTPLDLTDDEKLQRTPLSDCTISKANGGLYGKCCRDPDYTDPWPTGNLPKDYTGGFDEQGFPTFLNIQRNRPPQKKPITPIKTSFSGVKTYPPTQQPPRQVYTSTQTLYTTPKPIYTSSPANYPPARPLYTTPRPITINQGFTNVYSSPRPDTVPQYQPVPSTVVPISDKPQGFIQYSTTPIPYNKSYVDESSTNVKLTVIPSHTPGSRCGVKNSVERPSGLSDVDAPFSEIPWQAMILANRERKLLCSGALIAPNAVLTAARCVDGYQPHEVSVKLGEWRLGSEKKEEEPLPFELVAVEKIATHPGYSPGLVAYDVVVLLLEHPVHIDRHVDTICLDNEKPRPDMKCFSTGWGKIVLQSHVAGAVMHSIDVDVIDQQECLQRLEGAETKLEIDDSLVCTKAHRQNNNMCQVDLGGPLACDRGDGSYAIMGVYTQDTGCLPTNQVTTFATIDKSWVEYVLANPPKSPEVPQATEISTRQTPINIYQQSDFHAPGYLPPI